MHAAVLHAVGETPRYEEFAEPVPLADETIISVLAASLKNIDNSIASGAHYHRHDHLPAVPGVDGVGVRDDGVRVYFAALRSPFGAMAERSVASRTWTFPVPEQLDDVTAAALPNPALSSWLPLVYRAKLVPGETVLILGATGAAGQLAVQIAKHLGAGRVVAAGRNELLLQSLPALGADATISLNGSALDLRERFAQGATVAPFDVVLDYLWGPPTEALIAALTGEDVLAAPRPTRLIEIGSMAGPTIALPAAALRSSGLEISGSGGGSIPHEVIFEVIPRFMDLAATGTLNIATASIPLREVETAWERKPGDGRRLVFIP